MHIYIFTFIFIYTYTILHTHVFTAINVYAMNVYINIYVTIILLLQDLNEWIIAEALVFFVCRLHKMVVSWQVRTKELPKCRNGLREKNTFQ